MATQKANEILKNIIETKISINQLDDPAFREEQGLSDEDIVLIKEDLQKNIQENKEEMLNKVDKILILRRRFVSWIAGIENEKTLLDKTAEGHRDQIKKIEGFVNFVASVFNSDSKHKLSVPNGVFYLGKKAKRIEINQDKLPHALFRLKGLKTGLDPVKDFSLISAINEATDQVSFAITIDVGSLNEETKICLFEKGLITEEILEKKTPRTIKDIEEWIANLPEAEQEKNKDILKVIDNETQLKIDDQKI